MQWWIEFKLARASPADADRHAHASAPGHRRFSGWRFTVGWQSNQRGRDYLVSGERERLWHGSAPARAGRFTIRRQLQRLVVHVPDYGLFATDLPGRDRRHD